MKKKIITTLKTNDGQGIISLIRHETEQRILYTVEYTDYETGIVYGRKEFISGFDNAMKHFNRIV